MNLLDIHLHAFVTSYGITEQPRNGDKEVLEIFLSDWLEFQTKAIRD